MKLTLGPLLGHWQPQAWADFYARVADEADVDRVVLGEVVCSKRLPFIADLMAPAMERLSRAGKQVVLASLALVTLPRERALCADVAAATEGLVEVNDPTLLHYLERGRAFTVGPLVNVYNEGTLAYLAARGAETVCLPPELPLAAITALAAAKVTDIEVWGFGRVPLAISGRCYHARVHGLHKDSCQFVCGEDPDGLPVETLDHESFLAVNGVQTLSFTAACVLQEVDALKQAGVARLRLSPQQTDMVAVAKIFRERIKGSLAAAAAVRQLQALVPDMPLANGFMVGRFGAERITV